jgi:peptide/nickel transport system permease protein
LYFDPGETLKPPAWCEGGSTKHLLGTDGVGRDILSRIIYGSRVSITVASYVIGLSATFGIFLGLIAGYFRGLADTLLMRVADVMQAMPAMLFILALAAILPRGLKTVVIVLCVFGWAGYTRIIRGVVLSLREKDFIALARVAQASPLRIMFRHVLPNLVNIITVLMTLEVGGLILAEAGLSFIGVGIPSPTPSWGGMLSEGRKFISTAWWLATFPGLAIMAVVFSCNYIGDWVRDRLDPTLRQY